MSIEFKSDKTKSLFDCLVRFFTEDYMVKRLYMEQAGWRTVGELSAATRSLMQRSMGNTATMESL